MDIINFTEGFRVGEYPACLGIRPLGYTDGAGVYALAYDDSFAHRIELRRRDDTVALFVFRYDDTDLPEWWTDSEMLWTNQKGGI